MKKSDIERRLKQASDSFTPDVLNQIMARTSEPVYDSYYAETKVASIKQNSTKRKWVFAFAAVIIVLIGIGSFAGIMNQDYETVYLEINPAMEIVTNRLDRVKEIRFLNEDAEALFESYNYKWQKVESVVDMFVELSYEQGFINEENNNIYVYVNDRTKQERAQQTADRLKQMIKEKANQQNRFPNIEAQRISLEQSESAKDENISVAKMVLIEQILRKDNTYTLEVLKTKNIKELRDILKEEEKSDNNGNNDNTQNDNNPNNGNNGNSGNAGNNGNGRH